MPIDEDDAINDHEDKPIFYKSHKSALYDLNLYHKKLKCVDGNKIQIQGDYNSPKARMFVIHFEKCSNSDEQFDGIECKDQSEITEWLQRKFILTYTNQKRFIREQFNQNDKIVSEARVNWIPINTQIREEVNFRASLTQLNL